MWRTVLERDRTSKKPQKTLKTCDCVLVCPRTDKKIQLHDDRSIRQSVHVHKSVGEDLLPTL